MHSFGALDFYETRKNDSYDSDDILKVRDLYLPLIGGKAFSLYAFLMSEKPNNMVTHERMLGWLQLSVNEIYNAFLALEAVGLIKTLFQESPTANCFIYCIRSPLGPKDFLNEPLFSSLLRTYIGKDEYKIIESKYLKSIKLPGFKDVSETYSDYFGAPNENVLTKAKEKKAKLETSFDYSKLNNSLLSFGINLNSISDDDKEKIAKFAILYGYDADTMAEIVRQALVNGKIDFLIIEKQCRASMKFDYIGKNETPKSQVSAPSALKKKIEMMDEITPKEFLYNLQSGHRPSVKDLKLIQSLAFNANLSNPLINVIIDYALAKNDGILSYTYCENLGAILTRKGAKNAKDAMEILNSLPSNKVSYKKTKIEKEVTPVVEEEVKVEANKEEDSTKLETEEDIKNYLESFDD